MSDQTNDVDPLILDFLEQEQKALHPNWAIIFPESIKNSKNYPVTISGYFNSPITSPHLPYPFLNVPFLLKIHSKENPNPTLQLFSNITFSSSTNIRDLPNWFDSTKWHVDKNSRPQIFIAKSFTDKFPINNISGWLNEVYKTIFPQDKIPCVPSNYYIALKMWDDIRSLLPKDVGEIYIDETNIF